jgi:hypothetical protein
MTSYDGALSAILTGQERDVPTDVWHRPTTISFEDDALVHDGQLNVRVRSGRGMLLQFTRLATREDVQRYALKWGPLGLCHEHPLQPVAHMRTSSVLTLRVDEKHRYTRGCGEFSLREPLEVWLSYARRIQGLLRLAQKQLQNPGIHRLVPEDVGEIAAGRSPVTLDEICAAFPEIAFAIAQVGAKRMRLSPWALTSGLAFAVNGLLEWTGSRIALKWLEGRPQLVFGSVEPTLLGALALQLAFAIAGEPDTFLCSTCGKPFDPSEQRVRRGFRPYCLECRDSGAPQREAARRYRENQKMRRKR